MKFKFKMTIWDEVTVEKEYESEVLEAIKAGKVTSSTDIFKLFDGLDVDFRYIENTAQQMSIDQNQGHTTIKVLDDTNNLIFSNKRN